MHVTSAARWTLILIVLGIAGCASAPPSKAPTAPTAPSQQRAASKGDVRYDKFNGSCRAWESYISQSGVQDCAGRTHPGWIGATRCTVTGTGYKFTPKRDEGILGRTCFSVELPRNANQFKIASACVRIVDWVPVSAIPQNCADSRSNWLEQVLRHEEQHVYQCEQEVWNANQRWAKQTHRYSACGFTERGALSELSEKINDDMKAETKRIMDAIEAQSDRFHSSPQGQPLQTNCGVCN